MAVVWENARRFNMFFAWLRQSAKLLRMYFRHLSSCVPKAPLRGKRSLQLCLSTAQIVGCGFQLWLEAQCCFEFRDALLGFPAHQESRPQIVMSIATFGIQPQRLVKLIDSLRES